MSMSQVDTSNNTDTATTLRLLPNSPEAEQALIGGLMINSSAVDSVSELMVADDFFRREHRVIFKVMQELFEQNKPFDLMLLMEELGKRKLLQEAGGQDYLLELARNTASADNLLAYARLVVEYSIRRKLIQTSQTIADLGFNPGSLKPNELLDEAEKQVFALGEDRPKVGGPQSVASLTANVIDRLAQMKGNGITGISTGFIDLDKRTSGLQPSDLVIVAGRPSMGKTTFAMNLVEHAMLAVDKPVLVFSMEMPAEQLLIRMLSSLGQIDQSNLRTGNLTDQDWDRIGSTIHLIKDRKLFIDDTPGLTPGDMRGRTRRLVREHGDVSMIMVDYLQLMRVAGNSENRTNEISEISRSLKALAKEFKCPVVALSQLNRSLEQRTNRRPIMSDLRESGAIEQDADLIMFVYRDEVYDKDNPDNKGLAEIIIGKQRNGPIGTVHLLFKGHLTRFDNLDVDSIAKARFQESGLLNSD